MKNTLLKSIFATLILSLSTVGNASMIELNSDSFFGNLGGVGTGRGISFEALSDFSITSIGIEGALVAQNFEVLIWSSTDGRQADSILASKEQTFGDKTFGWNDISIDFMFDAGGFYALQWRPTVASEEWATSLSYYRDDSLPKAVNSHFNLIDGFERFDASNFGNFLHPNLRVGFVANEIPEPSMLALLGVMLLSMRFGRTKQ